MFSWKKKATNAIYLKEDNGGKGRPFEARFLEAGLVKYSFGVCLLTKETIDKFADGFVGCPVIIDHQDITDENVKEKSVGVISDVWYNEKDGWFWCKGIITDKEAIDLINKGYTVSCQYEITEYQENTENKLHNGNEFDKYILNGKPEHLAIVENPRYENAYIAVNAIEVKAENEKDTKQQDGQWITIKGNHIFVKEGETAQEAFEKVIGKQKTYLERSDKEHKTSKLKEFEQRTKEKEKEINKKYQKINIKEFKKGLKGTPIEIIYTNDDDSWLLTEDLRRGGGWSLVKAGEEVKTFKDKQQALEEWENGYFADLDRMIAQNNIKEQEMFNLGKNKEENVEEIKTMLEALTADVAALKARNEAEDEEKAKKADNEDDKEDDKKATNEDVNKRKLIDEIGGILKGKVDDELWRTIIGKVEKLAYEKSEAGTADNKCKNKCKNEDDEAEYDDLKKDVEEEAKNKKAKNSIEELFYSGNYKKEPLYTSQKQAIELGKEIF